MDILNILSDRFIPENSFFERFIDNVIDNADQFEFFHLSTLVESFIINESDKYILLNAIPEFENFLKKLNIIETNRQQNLVFNLTDFGRECKNIGGYSNFLNAKKIKDLVERTKEERKDKSEDLDLKIKGWTYRAKYVPFIFSGLAFAGMIFSIIISVKSLNSKTDKLDLQQVQQDLRQLKDHVELQDSLFRVDTFLRKRSK